MKRINLYSLPILVIAFFAVVYSALTINYYYYDEKFDTKQKIKITNALQDLFNILFPNVEKSKNKFWKVVNCEFNVVDNIFFI